MMIGNYLTDGKSSLIAFKDYWALLYFGSINFCDFSSSSAHSKFVQPSLNIQGPGFFFFPSSTSEQEVSNMLLQTVVISNTFLLWGHSYHWESITLLFSPQVWSAHQPMQTRASDLWLPEMRISLFPVATYYQIIKRSLGEKKVKP